MPVIHPFYKSTAPNALAVAVQTDSVDLKHWAKNQIRFPKRDVASLPAHRQLEHFSVDHALQRLGLDAADAHVIHDDNLKPHIERLDSTAIHQARSTTRRRCVPCVGCYELFPSSDVTSNASEFRYRGSLTVLCQRKKAMNIPPSRNFAPFGR